MLERRGVHSLGIKLVLWDSNSYKENLNDNTKICPCHVISQCHHCPVLLPEPSDNMKTRNVLCRPASNQLLAYDFHYLHLFQRVSGAQLGLHRQEKLVLQGGRRRRKKTFSVITFADCYRLELTPRFGWGFSVFVCVNQNQG